MAGDHASTRVAVAQMRTGTDVDANLSVIATLARKASDAGAQFVAFPEYATYMGDHSRIHLVAEPLEGGRTVDFVRNLATTHAITIHMGTVVEDGGDGHIYNTSVLVDASGEVLAIYRKIHLFQSIIPGASATESTYISPGSDLVVADWAGWNLGLSICFDMRFPELYRELAYMDANVLLIPSAFVAFTGRDHWEVLLRARAIENQAYVLAPAQIGKYEGGETYGRSCIIDPWGTVLAVVGDEAGAGIAVAEITHQRLEQVRADLPALANRRFSRASLPPR